MEIHGLRSPYEIVGGIVYFGRMIDKIRLHAAEMLPSGYQPLLGSANARSFDGSCCRFLQNRLRCACRPGNPGRNRPGNVPLGLRSCSISSTWTKADRLACASRDYKPLRTVSRFALGVLATDVRQFSKKERSPRVPLPMAFDFDGLYPGFEFCLPNVEY